MQQRTWKILLVSLACLASIILLIGRFQPDESAVESGDLNADSVKVRDVEPATGTIESSNDEKNTMVVPEKTQQTEADGDPIQPADEFDHAGTLLEVEQILVNETLTATDENRLRELQNQLTVIAGMREDLRAQFLDLLSANPHAPLAGFIVEILIRLGDPEVLTLGTSWLKSGDRDLILNGLEIVAQRPPDVLDEVILMATESLLIENLDDPEILISATQAMPVMPVDEQTRSRVVTTFQNLNTNPNGSVRSASLFALSQWAQSATELAPVVEALRSQDPDDRRSAVMALQDSALIDDEIGAALISRVGDETELWEVRRIAADALGRFTLNDEQTSMLVSFREQQLELVRGQ